MVWIGTYSSEQVLRDEEEADVEGCAWEACEECINRDESAGVWARVRLRFTDASCNYIEIQDKLSERCDEYVCNKSSKANDGDRQEYQREKPGEDARDDELLEVEFVEFGFGEEDFGQGGLEGCAALWADDVIVFVGSDA